MGTDNNFSGNAFGGGGGSGGGGGGGSAKVLSWIYEGTGSPTATGFTTDDSNPAAVTSMSFGGSMLLAQVDGGAVAVGSSIIITGPTYSVAYRITVISGSGPVVLTVTFETSKGSLSELTGTFAVQVWPAQISPSFFDPTTGQLQVQQSAGGDNTLAHASLRFPLGAIGGSDPAIHATNFAIFFTSNGQPAFVMAGSNMSLNGVPWGISGSTIGGGGADVLWQRLSAAVMAFTNAAGTQGMTVDASGSNTVLGSVAGNVAIKSGTALQLGNAATTGLAAGILAATTNATIVLYDSTGQAYRIPCII